MSLPINLLNQHIKAVLAEAGQILFPNNDLTQQLIKVHVWRDRDYVGDVNGAVNAWKGWSLNLSALDPRYRVIFIDVVENNLPMSENVRLFGEEFASHIAAMERFVVMLVTDFPLSSLEAIREHGFIPRLMTRAAHPCVIISEEEFLQTPIFYWAAKVTKLILLQRILSTHRKPIEANEIPLQNLLYKSGYLHQYIIESGLAIHHFSRPRKAGEFGHDFHLEVSNPKMSNALPFPFGIEIYITSMGYHIDTIPEYANKFDLRGMIIVSKDNPHQLLANVKNKFLRDLQKVPLRSMGDNNIIGIHHIPLDNIVIELSNLKNSIEDLL